jgi:hypothetical protein
VLGGDQPAVPAEHRLALVVGDRHFTGETCAQQDGRGRCGRGSWFHRLMSITPERRSSPRGGALHGVMRGRALLTEWVWSSHSNSCELHHQSLGSLLTL